MIIKGMYIYNSSCSCTRIASSDARALRADGRKVGRRRSGSFWLSSPLRWFWRAVTWPRIEIKCQVLDSAKIQVNHRARRVKTDQIGAFALRRA
jgi:hypothetical protein